MYEIVSICSSVGFGVLLPAPKRFTYVLGDRSSVSVLGGENMTGKFENRNIYCIQVASHLCTVCARAVLRIDQFVVFSPICKYTATFFVIFSYVSRTKCASSACGWRPLTCAPFVRRQLRLLIISSCFGVG